MSSKIRLKRLLFILLPFLTAWFVYLITPYFIDFMWNLLGVCRFYRYTGFMCPACGNTRSVTALMRGDLISSLRFNITPVVLLILAAGKYFEILLGLFSKRVKLLPRSLKFYISLIVFMVFYYIVRNFIPCLFVM